MVHTMPRLATRTGNHHRSNVHCRTRGTELEVRRHRGRAHYSHSETNELTFWRGLHPMQQGSGTQGLGGLSLARARGAHNRLKWSGAGALVANGLLPVARMLCTRSPDRRRQPSCHTTAGSRREKGGRTWGGGGGAGAGLMEPKGLVPTAGDDINRSPPMGDGVTPIAYGGCGAAYPLAYGEADGGCTCGGGG